MKEHNEFSKYKCIVCGDNAVGMKRCVLLCKECYEDDIALMDFLSRRHNKNDR